MKGAIILCLFALAAVAYAHPEGHYTDKYDNIDLDEILGNKKLLEGYMKCCLGEGKCTAEGNELKSRISDALQTDCSKCTEVQRNGSKKVIRHLINHEPGYWSRLKAKYDPTGKYAAAHEAEYTEAKH